MSHVGVKKYIYTVLGVEVKLYVIAKIFGT